MQRCEGELRQDLIDYWNNHGKKVIGTFPPDRMRCMTSADAYISSDRFFADQFVGIRIRLEHCQDYEDAFECASEEEIEAYWRKKSRKKLAVMIFHQQLDMKNQANPLQQTSRVEIIEANLNTRKLL